MRNRLLATIALAAVVGLGGIAAAQSQKGGASNYVPPGTTSNKIHQKNGAPISNKEHRQIKTAIARGHFPRVDRRQINFNIAVGSRVPTSVHVEKLPNDVVQVVPQYRGFDYFIISYRTRDYGGADYMFVKDQLVIVDPQTLEIVATIPV
jgi:Protein of unknown function (DUF1236)